MSYGEGVRDMLNLDFLNRHAVETGGTGALGTAVVQMLVDAGAVCHIPAHARPDPARFPLARHESVRVTAGDRLAGKKGRAGWSSCHSQNLAGGAAGGGV